jgi:hypothetical protein
MENQSQNNNLTPIQNKNGLVVRADIENIFAGDSYGLFVFKKTEKIVTAIYLLTGLMSDKEPMKEKLRALATEMLGTVFAMSERVWGEETFQKNLSNLICEVSVLFDIAERTRMMSKMNHQIIVTELKNLLDFLVTSSSNYSSAKIAFEPNMFDGTYDYTPNVMPQNKNIEASKNITSVDTEISQRQFNVKDITKTKISEQKKEDKNEKDVKDNDRQSTIISMLKSGAKLTIKDFAKNIKNCSDKTIQRELLSLVSKGILRKEGERRWSKYFLA